jgi:hypothetical protein
MVDRTMIASSALCVTRLTNELSIFKPFNGKRRKYASEQKPTPHDKYTESLRTTVRETCAARSAGESATPRVIFKIDQPRG